MTATGLRSSRFALAPGSSSRRRVAFELARLEAGRYLRHPVLWLGVTASVYSFWQSRSIEWTAGAYSAFPTDFVGCAWAMFVLGAVAGGRDHLPGDRTPPGWASPGVDDRATGRLLGLLAPLAVVVAVVAGVVIASRIEGGYTIGERGWSTDTAQPSWPEVAQPVLLFAAFGAIGVGMGRSVRHGLVTIVAGTAALFAFGLVAWAWQWSPAVYLTPVQIQPFSVRFDGGPAAAPDDWWLSAPGEHQAGWRRLIVDPVMALWHDVVLLGTGVAGVGWALAGGIGRRLVLIGIALVAIGAVAQAMVAPW